MRCKERLDHWQFVQELGGINSYHVECAIAWAKAEWDQDKAMEIADLKAENEAELLKMQKEEAGKALERLADVLLNLDSVVSVAPAGKKPASSITDTSLKSTGKETSDSAEPKPEPAAVSSEAWVESYKCTSCNDCTNKLPAVFKYNSDKQAFVHDPKKGTYAQIVGIAEKCPAKCIHPGLPQNPSEPGLDELIKRAEALN
jgi:ferredoxin